jgi:pyruvate dehydrogenase (quinone)
MKEYRSWRAKIEGEVSRWWKILEKQATQDAEPLNRQRLFHKLSPRLPEGCNVTVDSGLAMIWWARHLKLREDLMAALSVTVATTEPAAVYVLDAKFAHPDRPMIATLGDGTSRCSAPTRW